MINSVLDKHICWFPLAYASANCCYCQKLKEELSLPIGKQAVQLNRPFFRLLSPIQISFSPSAPICLKIKHKSDRCIDSRTYNIMHMYYRVGRCENYEKLPTWVISWFAAIFLELIFKELVAIGGEIKALNLDQWKVEMIFFWAGTWILISSIKKSEVGLIFHIRRAVGHIDIISKVILLRLVIMEQLIRLIVRLISQYIQYHTFVRTLFTV